MGYSVIIEESAHEDIREAHRWMSQYSPERAALWHFDLEEAIYSLEQFPFRCPLAPENQMFPDEIRQLIFEKYRILFTVKDEDVHILHVWHSRRDYAQPAADEL